MTVAAARQYKPNDPAGQIAAEVNTTFVAPVARTASSIYCIPAVCKCKSRITYKAAAVASATLRATVRW